MIIDSPVFASQSVLPTTGIEGQTCVVTGVGAYNYINGAWEKVLDAGAPAASADKLATPRKINGVDFDGTADITISGGGGGGEPVITPGDATQYWRGDKTFQTLNKAAVGLDSVDNTADSAKPVSAAQQTALDLKLDKTANAASATKLATSRKINGVDFDGTADVSIPAGAATTATKLETARNINGVAFDGTANITITDGTKEPSFAVGTNAQYLRGDKTFVDLASTVAAFPLTGLSLASALPVTATDTQLAATGKLQAQVTGLVKVAAVAASAIDCSAGSYFTKTITTVTAFTVSNVPASGTCASIMLELVNGGSSTVTWFSGVTWAGGTAPTLTAAGTDVLGFYTLNGGSTWRGFLMAKDIK